MSKVCGCGGVSAGGQLDLVWTNSRAGGKKYKIRKESTNLGHFKSSFMSAEMVLVFDLKVTRF